MIGTPIGIPPRRSLALALAAAALGLAVAAIVLAEGAPPGRDRGLIGFAHALLIATPVLVGLYALEREPDSRFARLLVVAGFLWAPSLLATSDDSVAYSIGRIGAWIVELGVVLLALAYPAGVLRTRPERVLAAAMFAALFLLYLPSVLFLTHFPEPSPWSTCRHDCPANAFSVVGSESHFMHSVVEPVRDALVSLLFLAAAGILAGKVARASRPMRRTMLPAIAGGLAALGGTAAFLVSRRIAPWSEATENIGYVAVLAIPALALGFAISLLRWRMVAGGALRRLTSEFEDASSGARVRDLIADAVGDPSLEIAYWTGDPGRWVDQSGVPVVLPRDDASRSVTEIKSRGHSVAALVHDPALVAERSVTETVGGFALMALENMRLDAELRSSLRELRASRARILSAVDFERQRIERDLHDGAQQRLVALRVALDVAAEMIESDPQGAAGLLAKLGTDVESTLDDVRSLARGVYPPLLADHGIGEALRMAARTSPLPTTVRSRGLGRYSQQIESAVYFTCLEALQNAAKHSGAARATITLSETDELRFEVTDDGKGFVPTRSMGLGLHNMRDRIVTLGGRLTVESAPGEGTRVTGTVPVGLAQLTPDVASLFQRATDALQDCFAIYKAVHDSSGTVVDFAVEHLNDAACRDAGRSRESQVGRTLGYLDRDYLSSDLFDWHRKALESDSPSLLDDVSYETGAEGRQLLKAYEVRAVAVGGDRLAVTWRDITTRKQAQDTLSRSQRNVGAAARGLPLSLFTMDRDLRYTWTFNQNGDLHVVGRTDEEIFGREAARRLLPIYERALAGTPVRGEVELELPEGTVVLDLSVAPLRDENGQIVGIAGGTYDLGRHGHILAAGDVD